MLKIILFFVQLFLVVSGQNEYYKGYKVYNVRLENQSQEDNFYLLKSDVIDYWRKPSLKHGIVGKAMVPPSYLEWFEGQLAKLGLDRDIAIEDVFVYLNSIKENKDVPRNGNGTDGGFDIYNYHRYDVILQHLRWLENEYANSTEVSLSLVQAGETDERRPLVYIKIKSANITDDPPIVVIEAGIIPREWITVPSALNIVYKLLSDGQRYLIENFEWVIIPVLNPDGYEYTHTNLRLWTKNRSLRTNLGFVCPGVNLNRNFGVAWGVSDSSSSPCSHIFRGNNPFSEPEARLVREIIKEFEDRSRLYFSIQNTGGSDGFISYPWQFERAASGMFRQHHLLGLEMVNAINGTYILDVGFAALGDRASGTSSDFAMKENLLFTFNIDVVQRGINGVQVPVEEIADVVEDVWTAVATAATSFI